MAGLSVWLDDERPMPPGYDIHVKTSQEAIALLKTGQVEFISLDNDLGPDSHGEGYDVAKFIEQAAYEGTLPAMRSSQFRVHTQNESKKPLIKMALSNAVRFWNRRNP